MIYECENDDELCADVCKVVPFDEMENFKIIDLMLIPKLTIKKRSYSNVPAEFVDHDEWNVEFIPKVRKVLAEETMIIKNIKDILPLWEEKNSRFKLNDDMQKYIMNELARQFKSDNFEVRSILSTALDFFSKLCIIQLMRFWPFK
jgi:hypothetical protein